MIDKTGILNLTLAALLAACANLYIDPIDALRDRNKHNIALLSVGMTRQQVDQIMGTDTAGGTLGTVHRAQVSNPYRVETVTGADHTPYEILFYYTDLRARDDRVSNDELTPVLLQDGNVVGVGYQALGARVPAYRVPR